MTAALQSKTEQISRWMNYLLDDKEGKPLFRGKTIDLRTFLLLIIEPKSNLFLKSHKVEQLERYLDESVPLEDYEIGEARDHKGIFSVISPLFRRIVIGNTVPESDYPVCDNLTPQQMTNPNLSNLSEEQKNHLLQVLDRDNLIRIKECEAIGGSKMSLDTDISSGSTPRL